MKTFPTEMVYDHFAHACANAGPLPEAIPPMVYIAHVKDGVLVGTALLPQASTDRMMIGPDGADMLHASIAEMVAETSSQDPDAFAVVLVAEARAKIVSAHVLAVTGDLSLLQGLPVTSSLLVAVHRADGTHANLLTFDEARRVVYAPMLPGKAVLAHSDADAIVPPANTTVH